MSSVGGLTSGQAISPQTELTSGQPEAKKPVAEWNQALTQAINALEAINREPSITPPVRMAVTQAVTATIAGAQAALGGVNDPDGVALLQTIAVAPQFAGEVRAYHSRAQEETNDWDDELDQFRLYDKMVRTEFDRLADS